MGIPRTHEVTYRVRFDEADATGHLRPSGLLRYAQDLAWQHSESAGFGREWYAHRATFWLVRMATLRIWAPVTYGDEVIATTELTGWRRVSVRRHTTFRDPSGTITADADTDWVLVTDEGRLSRVPVEISQHLMPGSVYKPERVELPPTPSRDVLRSTSVVRAADIDPLGHLNNAAYLDIIDESTQALRSDRGAPASYRLEFVHPALVGTTLSIKAWRPDEASIACRLLEDDVELCRAIAGWPTSPKSSLAQARHGRSKTAHAVVEDIAEPVK